MARPLAVQWAEASGMMGLAGRPGGRRAAAGAVAEAPWESEPEGWLDGRGGGARGW